MRGLEARPGAEIGHAAFLEKDQRVGDFLSQVRVVRDHDGGFVQRCFELQDQVAGVRGHQRIDHRGGLVVEDGLGILRQGAGDGHGALGAGAQFGGQLVEEFG